jgi:hypothetical protein
MSHHHKFDESAWPFDTPINSASFTTRFVIDGSRPVLEVYHEHDGDWQFLCGTTLESADLKLVCMGCMLDLDPSLGELATLPYGWRAYRSSPNQAWKLEEFEEDDAPEDA